MADDPEMTKRIEEMADQIRPFLENYEWMSPEAVCDHLQCTPSMLAQLRKDGFLEPELRYRRADVELMVDDFSKGILKPLTPKARIAERGRRERYLWVYFIRRAGDGAIKIGYSRNPERRLRDLSVGQPVELLGSTAGGPRRERELHRQFAQDRLDGEWFKPSAELLSFISDTSS